MLRLDRREATMERAVFAADKSIFALDKRRTGPAAGAGPQPTDAAAGLCCAVKDKVSGIMLMGTLKAETSTRMQNGEWRMEHGAAAAVGGSSVSCL